MLDNSFCSSTAFLGSGWSFGYFRSEFEFLLENLGFYISAVILKGLLLLLYLLNLFFRQIGVVTVGRAVMPTAATHHMLPSVRALPLGLWSVRLCEGKKW